MVRAEIRRRARSTRMRTREGGRWGGGEIRWLGLASGRLSLRRVWRMWNGLSLLKLMFSFVCMIILFGSVVLIFSDPEFQKRLEHS